MKRSIRLLVFVAVALAGYSANTTNPSTSAGSGTPIAAGLSREQAVTAATPTAQIGSTTPVSLISAASGRYGDFDQGGGLGTAFDPNRHVWAVLYSGTFQSSCGATASPHPCPTAGPGTVRVVIDYVSGAVIIVETMSTTS